MKIKRTLYELMKGSKAYLPKKQKTEGTSRTNTISDKLKAAGLSEADIKRLRNKK